VYFRRMISIRPMLDVDHEGSDILTDPWRENGTLQRLANTRHSVSCAHYRHLSLDASLLPFWHRTRRISLVACQPDSYFLLLNIIVGTDVRTFRSFQSAFVYTSFHDQLKVLRPKTSLKQVSAALRDCRKLPLTISQTLHSRGLQESTALLLELQNRVLS
jgi:hypothetical protein